MVFYNCKCSLKNRLSKKCEIFPSYQLTRRFGERRKSNAPRWGDLNHYINDMHEQVASFIYMYTDDTKIMIFWSYYKNKGCVLLTSMLSSNHYHVLEKEFVGGGKWG